MLRVVHPARLSLLSTLGGGSAKIHCSLAGTVLRAGDEPDSRSRSEFFGFPAAAPRLRTTYDQLRQNAILEVCSLFAQPLKQMELRRSWNA